MTSSRPVASSAAPVEGGDVTNRDPARRGGYARPALLGILAGVALVVASLVHARHNEQVGLVTVVGALLVAAGIRFCTESIWLRTPTHSSS